MLPVGQPGLVTGTGNPRVIPQLSGYPVVYRMVTDCCNIVAAAECGSRWLVRCAALLSYGGMRALRNAQHGRAVAVRFGGSGVWPVGGSKGRGSQFWALASGRGRSILYSWTG